MLLTDGNPNTTEDLRVYESAILNLAHTEMINLDVKLALATEEISQEVLDFILNRSAVGDPHAATRRQIGVSDVVVTRQMKRWHALHALSVICRDGFFNQFNDRYKQKADEYKHLARRAKDQTLLWGIGISFQPIPKASAPILGSTAGALAEKTYWARIGWVGANGAESAPSEMNTFMTPSGSLLTVESPEAPGNVTGFNVYLGLTPETVTLQNSSPVVIDQTFTLPGSGVVEGDPVGDGQDPDVYLTGGTVMRRG